MNRSIRMILWGTIAVIGLILIVINILIDSHRVWIGILGGFVFFTPLSAGLITWSAIVNASHGSWPKELEKFPLSAIGCVIPVIITFIILWIGSPWWRPSDAQFLKHPLFFCTIILFTRDFIAIAFFWILAFMYHHRRHHGPARRSASWLIITYSVVISIIAIDLIMAYSPWRSSVFGAYVFITGLYASAVVWTLATIVNKFLLGNIGVNRPEYSLIIKKLHDLGKLVFAFSILSSYLLFCQILPIWYENLPEEVPFLISRINFGPWNYVSIGLLVTTFLGPILFLMPLNAKRNPWFLGGMCIIIIFGLWIERLWLTLPPLHINSLALVDFGVLFMLSGSCAVCMEMAYRYLPVSLSEEGNHG